MALIVAQEQARVESNCFDDFIAMALEAAAFENICPSRYICFTIPNPSCSNLLLHVAVLDSPVQPTDLPEVGAMLVPEGREADWIFSTELGHLQLLFSSPGISRLILIGNQLKEGDTDLSPHIYHRPLKCSLHQQGFEVWSKPLLLALSPRSLFRDGIPEIPLLNYEDNLISSVVIHKCVGFLVGEMLVEDVEIESESDVHSVCLKREFRRRLRFKRMPNLIQTEIRIVPSTDCSRDSVRIEDVEFMPNHRVLVHPYLAPMVASLSLTSEYVERQIQNGFKPKALCLGVGGGALLTFLKTQLNFEVMGVESDRDVLRVAKDYFGLEGGKSIQILVGDSIKFMKKLAFHENMYGISSFDGSECNGFSHLLDPEVSHNFDVVMVDLDSSDIRKGMSSPPLEFVRRDVLLAAKLVVSENGILVINVIPPSKSFYDNLVNHLQEVFCELYRIDVGNGENFVLIATVSSQLFPVEDYSNSFFMRLKSVIPEACINSISKI